MSDIWTCKIGETVARLLPPGADGPMRAAVERAYVNLTGREPDFLFSGWGGELTESERAAHEDREPVPPVDALPEGYRAVIDTTPLRGQSPPSSPYWVLAEVAKERSRQDAKWGEQDHPLVDPDLTAWISDMTPSVGAASRGVAQFYRVPTAGLARELCQANDREHDNWAAILLEEFCEFIEAAGLGDETGARAELRQLAAVAVAAIEAMDRRKA